MQNSVNKKMPERKCIGCSEKKAKKDLIRIVRLPDEQGVEIDRTGKKSGRGAYICHSLKCLKKARKSRRLEKSLECEIPEAVYDRMEEELESDE